MKSILKFLAGLLLTLLMYWLIISQYVGCVAFITEVKSSVILKALCVGVIILTPYIAWKLKDYDYF